MHILLLQIIFLIVTAAVADAYAIAKLNRLPICGNVSIPYPFGMGKGCYHDDSFAITCNTTFNPDRPFLSKFNLEVLEVNLNEDTITVMSPVASNCKGQHRKGNSIWSSSNFSGSPYYLSPDNNIFVKRGCDNAQLINYDEDITIGCNPSSTCKTNASFCVNGLLFTSPLTFYHVSIEERNTTTGCTYAFLRSSTVLGSADRFAGNTTKEAPVLISWKMENIDSYKYCSYYEGGYHCSCPSAHNGNPYLPNGCKLAKACANCKAYCKRFPGTYDQYHCGNTREIILGSSLGGILGFLLLGGFCFAMFKLIKKKRTANLKMKFFKRNGGLLLEQQIVSNEGTINKTILFSADELFKATDNYNKNRILGQGGQGTVYKGMLTDGRITAVKKSKVVDESQLEQFINEVVILSQINHRNIVKLLGCCLETEVPLLVYEFVLNRNLFDLIHNKNEDFPLSWKMRLQIATQVAGGLAYLHSAASIPIYHRDIKSTNILLDEKFRAKIADFGTSRSIAIEQTHLTTLVSGTFGYLDSEYFRSSQFTDKSDVYSFGVVLAELLTGQKPISSLTELEEERSLAARFIYCVEQMRVLDIIDARVLEEASNEAIIAVSDIARRCLNLDGRKRPRMIEVFTGLDVISQAPSSTVVPMSFNTEKNMIRLGHDDYSTPTMKKSDYNTLSSSDVEPLVFHAL